MKRPYTDEELARAPCAAGVGIFFCPDPECGRPHVVLVDLLGKPMAHFVVPEPKPDGTGFMHELKKATKT